MYSECFAVEILNRLHLKFSMQPLPISCRIKIIEIIVNSIKIIIVLAIVCKIQRIAWIHPFLQSCWPMRAKYNGVSLVATLNRWNNHIYPCTKPTPFGSLCECYKGPSLEWRNSSHSEPVYNSIFSQSRLESCGMNKNHSTYFTYVTVVGLCVIVSYIYAKACIIWYIALWIQFIARFSK